MYGGRQDVPFALWVAISEQPAGQRSGYQKNGEEHMGKGPKSSCLLDVTV